ncbi:MAG: 3-methyl-2-oxobutanoate hydroxymethyltransferase [Acidobacteria bacterium]|nr:3-methyl-2-oxobutanoate hydroxymethyltransferase [Acidobacteriota bacterium]
MSTQTGNGLGRVTIPSILKKKSRGEKIVMLTAYDYQTARILDDSAVDIILVGDSLGNVIMGYENTIPVTVEESLHYTKAVARAVKRLPVITDMPFLSYQVSHDEALQNAGKFLKEGGAIGVKVEGASPFRIETIKRLVDAGIPVMGHLGLTPQSVYKLGGFRTQARKPFAAVDVVRKSVELEAAGVFSIVLENIPSEVAKEATAAVEIATIGIGAGPDCDGQVLVINDILGFSGDFIPPFVKRYAEMGEVIKDAVSRFSDDVRSVAFPAEEHTTKMSDENREKFYEILSKEKKR